MMSRFVARFRLAQTTDHDGYGPTMSDKSVRAYICIEWFRFLEYKYTIVVNQWLRWESWTNHWLFDTGRSDWKIERISTRSILTCNGLWLNTIAILSCLLPRLNILSPSFHKSNVQCSVSCCSWTHHIHKQIVIISKGSTCWIVMDTFQHAKH